MKTASLSFQSLVYGKYNSYTDNKLASHIHIDTNNLEFDSPLLHNKDINVGEPYNFIEEMMMEVTL